VQIIKATKAARVKVRTNIILTVSIVFKTGLIGRSYEQVENKKGFQLLESL
jgi:hypothetical protein